MPIDVERGLRVFGIRCQRPRLFAQLFASSFPRLDRVFASLVFHYISTLIDYPYAPRRNFGAIANEKVERVKSVEPRALASQSHSSKRRAKKKKNKKNKKNKKKKKKKKEEEEKEEKEEEEEEKEEKEKKEKKEKFAANGVPLMNAFFVPGKQRGPGAISSGGRKALQACQELSKQRGIDTVTQWLPALLTNESAQGRRGTARNWPGAKVGRPSFERGIDSNLATVRLEI
uniref:Uncharacterized protein n=1 Tax=Vespula pensylvanica TaxID=30213 RepID=A0A834JYX5_VESPE|nr:hypothetical protein H0235_016766 [Vespula pensylvanica]